MKAEANSKRDKKTESDPTVFEKADKNVESHSISDSSSRVEKEAKEKESSSQNK